MGWLRWYPAPPAPPPDNLTSFLSKLSQNTRTGFYLVNLNYHLIPSHLQQRKPECRFLSILASYWALLVLLKVSVCSPVFARSLWTLASCSSLLAQPVTENLSGVLGEGSTNCHQEQTLPRNKQININTKQSVMCYGRHRFAGANVRKYIPLWCWEQSH